jgi:hypothetical protein
MNREQFDKICQSVNGMIMMPVDDYNKLVDALNQFPASMQEEIDRLQEDNSILRTVVHEKGKSAKPFFEQLKEFQSSCRMLRSDNNQLQEEIDQQGKLFLRIAEIINYSAVKGDLVSQVEALQAEVEANKQLLRKIHECLLIEAEENEHGEPPISWSAWEELAQAVEPPKTQG